MGAAALLAWERPPAALWTGGGKDQPVLSLVNPSGNCLQRESFAGYFAALREIGAQSTLWAPGARRNRQVIILSAATMLDGAIARNIFIAMRRGACVLLESVAGFLEEEEFAAARRALQRHLEISIESPINLRSSEQGQGCVPFIDFAWPLRAKVRDFSRVVPVCSRESATIARAGGLPVGARRKVGAGTLIFLGTLVSPSLGAQDPEARQWLQEVLRFA